MARIDCPFESDVLDLVTIGAWPAQAPADLRAHVEACEVCCDLALISSAVSDARMQADATPPLPSAGTVWWRAQIRARQEAVRDVARPISVAYAMGFAACVGVAGAVFGATTGWFQRMMARAGGFISERVAALDLPTFDLSVFTTYSTALIIVGIGLALTMAVVFWAFREDA